MKIKEQLQAYQAEIKKVKDLATKAATNTEKYYWEVKQLREAVNKLAEISEGLTEALLAIIKQQIGD